MKSIIIIFFSTLFGTSLLAESRAYLLDVFDHVTKDQWEIKTNFAPDTYINTHGGRYRLSVMIKATWMCYGDNSHFNPPCEMPKPKKPRFKVGDSVKVTLDKHLTRGWTGKVVISLYRADLKSNVYGVNFGGKRKLYNRYYEFNLNNNLQIDINEPAIGQPGPFANSQPTTQKETQAGTQAGDQLGVQPGTQAGVQPGTQAGVQPGTQVGPQVGPQTGPEGITQPGTQTPVQPDSELGTIDPNLPARILF
ncbi:MAG: hypothetical protein GY786_22485 [Proteobacteria bacterium]|nr:hypothetical protein [Pseudomonadota bacterium]